MSNAHILVVEDEIDILDLIQYNLEKEGFRVTSSQTVEQALKIARTASQSSFRTVLKARSRELGGTGLGLSIVKHISQSHDGRVSVESSPGKGSTFTIHLPIYK